MLVIGSGDNRARSILGDFGGGFSAPGTLFVAFDMPMLSVGMDTPDWPGRTALSRGLAYIRTTLGLGASIPQYLAGFSAGGAAAMVQDGKRIDIEGFAGALAKGPGIAAVSLEGVDHRPAAIIQRPDGKPWTIDARELMMRFFRALEKR